MHDSLYFKTEEMIHYFTCLQFKPSFNIYDIMHKYCLCVYCLGLKEKYTQYHLTFKMKD